MPQDIASSIELGRRIAAARMAAGIDSQAELARRLGVTRSAVSQWESGQARPSTKTLCRIAMQTARDVDWLATGRTPQTIPTTRVVGIVEGEAWRDGLGVRQEMKSQSPRPSKLAPCVPHPNPLNIRQFAFEVRGNSANLTAHAGEYAICIDYHEARPSGLHESDLVVLEKRRSGEYKTMIARLQFVDGAWELHYQSNDLPWQLQQPIRLSEDGNRDINDPSVQEIEIIAFVLGFYRGLARHFEPLTTL
jgi:transcriptional regulator with XRE-family HTH domain